jgi:P4 family phage/plasmid primase-like protien
MNYFAKKKDAKKNLKANQFLANKDITQYFIVDSYKQFTSMIISEKNPTFFEHVCDDLPCCLFFDIEIYQKSHPLEFLDCNSIIDNIKTVILFLCDIPLKFIILESHSILKKSFHIIIRGNTIPIYVKNVKIAKQIVSKLFPTLTLEKIIDVSVYRDGLFRTFLSSKKNENRPLVKSNLSGDFNPIETLVQYTLNLENAHFLTVENDEDVEVDKNKIVDVNNLETVLVNNDQENIYAFVKQFYRYSKHDVSDIKIDKFGIIVAIKDKFCHNIKRQHSGNHQYILINGNGSRQKCHDEDCRSFKALVVVLHDLPLDIRTLVDRFFVNSFDGDLIVAKSSAHTFLKTFDPAVQVDDLEYDIDNQIFQADTTESSRMVFLDGKCKQCRIKHQVGSFGYCVKCLECNTQFPADTLIPIPINDNYSPLNKFLIQQVGCTNIVNVYNNGEQDFTCDVKLDTSLFGGDKKMATLYNNILDGHKTTKTSELLSICEPDFKYSNGQWFHFNGCIWKLDKESIELRKRILKLTNNFNNIKQHYESLANNESNTSIVKNIKSLVNKINKMSFQEDIVKGAKLFYNDEEFIGKLNCKKHLVPFKNGVYDLLKSEFRPTTKEDYVNLVVGFNYDSTIHNIEVVDFINSILSDLSTREYVLKRFADCLNGDIQNTLFLMFEGQGANGKSQLLNLMNITMGELGEKVEVTLLTRKRNNANESNCEKIKLMNKRFAFLSEPENGEKINAGLLKELTGSEEIVARGLYQESMSFTVEAKFFLACNEKPETNGEDTALWRRIRNIEFTNRFVENPIESNEYKIDMTLPSRMKEDITWRQTFMNILIDYYIRSDITEPETVKLKTNEYRDENNDMKTWLTEYIQYCPDSICKFSEISEKYFGKIVGSRISSPLKKQVEQYIKETYPNYHHSFTIQHSSFNKEKYKGWLHFKCL